MHLAGETLQDLTCPPEFSKGATSFVALAACCCLCRGLAVLGTKLGEKQSFDKVQSSDASTSNLRYLNRADVDYARHDIL